MRKKEKPVTRLRLDKLLGDHSVIELSKEMGVIYTQIYPYRRIGANPTLLILEKMAKGLSKLNGRKISISELIGEK